ncbi:hypothetical protein GSI_03081 [Ganoderma sinense ZZ0214-1]|uniref:FAD-binding domain-containing protein n=1 Tax=Ganoderma sinense ZZ0214-1 TaxID=1077348 RepID=A0A2G8SKL2_9APHY|nr:hypothetical protein GSI_03081 [Ganoderma sinense ZZ0214-1]
MTSPRLRVAIVGAGLGGLLLALSLQKSCQDLRVDIYESTAELTEIGAGVGMWPRMWEIIEHLGLSDELKEVSGAHNPHGLISSAVPAQPVHIRKEDESEPVEFFQLPPTLYTFHRSVLQKLLARHLGPSIAIHFSKRLVSYIEPTESDEPIVLQFCDGTSAKCDVLVGSDGIRSAVRRSMFNVLADEACGRGEMEDSARIRSMVDPVWSGQVAYRGLIPSAALKSSGFEDTGSPAFLLGKNKAHAMTPHLGAGACQALEDGFILAAIIAQPTVTLQNLHVALGIYDSVRRPFAEMVLRRSRRNGFLFHFNTLGWEDVTAEQSMAGGFSAERLGEVGKALEEQFGFLFTSSIMEARGRAIDMVRALKRE